MTPEHYIKRKRNRRIRISRQVFFHFSVLAVFFIYYRNYCFGQNLFEDSPHLILRDKHRPKGGLSDRLTVTKMSFLNINVRENNTVQTVHTMGTSRF